MNPEEQRAQYRSTCSARRNGKTVEVLSDGKWTNERTFPSVAQAKKACRNGRYDGQRVYRV